VLLLQDLVSFIKERKGQCGIIYARLRYDHRAEYCCSNCVPAGSTAMHGLMWSVE
jgi:hypothetical protein